MLDRRNKLLLLFRKVKDSLVWVDPDFTLNNYTKTGTNYVCDQAIATANGGVSTTALLTGDFKIRSQHINGLDTGNSLVGATASAADYSILNTTYTLQVAVGTSLPKIRVDGATVTNLNNDPMPPGDDVYIEIERIGTVVNFWYDNDGTRTLKYSATGRGTEALYFYIQANTLGNWVQKPEYTLLIEE